VIKIQFEMEFSGKGQPRGIDLERHGISPSLTTPEEEEARV